MIIKAVDTKKEAQLCDQLLTKLINSEKIYNDNIRDSYTVKNWYEKSYLEKNRKLFIAFINDQVVGYIHIRITSSVDGPTKELEALLDGLYVEEEYRNQGIATKLIGKAIEWAKKQSVKYVTLEVLDQNEIAKKLYQHLDFCLFKQVLRKEIEL